MGISHNLPGKKVPVGYHGRIRVMPDVRLDEWSAPIEGSPKSFQALRAHWTYFQSPRGIVFPDGVRLLYGDGGGNVPPGEDWPKMLAAGSVDSPFPPFGNQQGQLREEIWAMVNSLGNDYYNLMRWKRLFYPTGDEHDSSGSSLISLPDGFPYKFALFSSCNNLSTYNQAYKGYVGIRCSNNALGPYVTCGAIGSRHEFEPPVSDPWWPPGPWSIGSVIVNGNVLVVVYDPGVNNNADGQRTHGIVELLPNLTWKYVGEIHFNGIEKPAHGKRYTWLTHVCIDSNGKLRGLDCGGDMQYSTDVIEWISDTQWNGGTVTLSRSGRSFNGFPVGGKQIHVSGAGYVCRPDGTMFSNTVLSDASITCNPWNRGEYWLQWWADDEHEARWLATEVEPIKLGPLED